MMQCRTAKAANSTAATVFVAFAVQENGGDIIQFSYNAAAKAINIYVNGTDKTQYFTDQNLTALETASPSSTPPYRIEVQNSSVTYTSTFCSFTVSLGYLSLSTQFNMPTSASGLLQGLLGNFDGNATNDFVMRNGTVLSNNSLESQLYPFGQSCKCR